MLREFLLAVKPVLFIYFFEGLIEQFKLMHLKNNFEYEVKNCIIIYSISVNIYEIYLHSDVML